MIKNTLEAITSTKEEPNSAQERAGASKRAQKSVGERKRAKTMQVNTGGKPATSKKTRKRTSKRTGKRQARGQARGQAKGQGRGQARGQGRGQARAQARGQTRGQAEGQARGQAKGQARAQTNRQNKHTLERTWLSVRRWGDDTVKRQPHWKEHLCQ